MGSVGSLFVERHTAVTSRYSLECELGRGGMGPSLQLARDPVNNHECTVSAGNGVQL